MFKCTKCLEERTRQEFYTNKGRRTVHCKGCMRDTHESFRKKSLGQQKEQKMSTKKCKKCEIIKPLGYFRKSNTYKDGYRPTCKRCLKEERSVPFYEATESEIERFWSKTRLNNHTGCLEWIESLDDKGYPYFSFRNQTVRGHRFSYGMTSKEEIPKGRSVCHSCDNPNCVNPKHLWLGTSQDNTADRVRKDRSSRVTGENNKISKLTNKQVRHIREEYAQGKVRQVDIVRKYSLSPSAVHAIVHNKTYVNI